MLDCNLLVLPYNAGRLWSLLALDWNPEQSQVFLFLNVEGPVKICISEEVLIGHKPIECALLMLLRLESDENLNRPNNLIKVLQNPRIDLSFYLNHPPEVAFLELEAPHQQLLDDSGIAISK